MDTMMAGFRSTTNALAAAVGSYYLLRNLPLLNCCEIVMELQVMGAVI